MLSSGSAEYVVSQESFKRGNGDILAISHEV